MNLGVKGDKMKISVIVPVYNSEKYIRRCIESVLRQKYKNWELILVDDGSVDSSFKIINEYSKVNRNVIVIHEENSGPGIARNTGISYSSGEYIVFLDSDDEIQEDYLQLLASHNEDIVFVDVLQKDSKGHILCEEKISKYCSCAKDEILRKQMTGAIPWGGCRKAVKTRLLIEHEIRYTDDKVGEEAVFSFLLLYFASSIGFINRFVYFYNIHEGSLSTTVLDDPWGPVVKKMIVTVRSLSVYDKYANTLNSFIVSSTAISLRRLATYYKWNEYSRKSNDRLNCFESMLDSLYSTDHTSLRKEAMVMEYLIKKRMKLTIYIIAKLYNLIKR